MNNQTAERIKVMIADDHPIVCSGLRSIIDSTDDMRVVATAEDTDSAILKATNHELDILVLDIGLPGAGGLEVLRSLRNSRPNLKILVLSLEKEKMYGELTIREGASGYLNKSKPPNDIIKAISDVLSGEIVANEETIESLKRTTKIPLTPTEIKVARLLVTGERNCDIANLLNISEKTVNTHRTNILKKLHLPNLSALIEYIKTIGL